MDVTIAIDQGNSRAKVALFAHGELLEIMRFEPLCAAHIEEIAAHHHVRRAIYSSVRLADVAVTNAIARVADEVIQLSHLTPMPLVIDYATPASLGHDRIAAAVGALTEFPGRNCLVVDAGTAITLDVVTASGHFAGGRISPGVRMRLNALHSFTSRLPLVDATGDVPFVGYDTASAIRSGVIQGVVGEIESCFLALQNELGNNLLLILTGGDAKLIASLSHIDSIIVDENILLKGLNRILQYNDEL